MADYKKMISQHSCKPHRGCGPTTRCMCDLAEDMADEIERLREALQSIEDLCNSEIKIRFRSSRMKEEEVAGSSKIYSMLSIPRNIARSALKGGSDDRHC